jgi:hypothetical protein
MTPSCLGHCLKAAARGHLYSLLPLLRAFLWMPHSIHFQSLFAYDPRILHLTLFYFTTFPPPFMLLHDVCISFVFVSTFRPKAGSLLCLFSARLQCHNQCLV